MNHVEGSVGPGCYIINVNVVLGIRVGVSVDVGIMIGVGAIDDVENRIGVNVNIG